MTITSSQRTSIMIAWSAVCKDRGWKSSDRALRMATFAKIVGRSLKSTNDVERIHECTKLMKELKAMLGVDIKAAREADDLSINAARVLRNQILTQLVPCLELYVADVVSYMAEIMEDKNRWWKIERPARGMTLMDLDATPIHYVDRKTGEHRVTSQLEQMRDTLAARLNTKRNAAGHTIHEMKVAAMVFCACAKCSQDRWNAMSSQAQADALGAPVTVGVDEPNWTV